MSVYEIPDEPHPADGWTPGLPGRELGTETPATEWELPTPTPVVPASPPSDPAKPVYTVESDQEAVLGWTPTPAPTTRRAARLASALGAGHGSGADPFGAPGAPVGAGSPAVTPAPASQTAPVTPSWSDPRFDEFDELTSGPASGGAGSIMSFASAAPVSPDLPPVAPAAVPAAAPVAPATPSSGFAAPYMPDRGRSAVASAPSHAAPVNEPAAAAVAPTAVLRATAIDGVELHEHARTVAHPGLIAALVEVVRQGASDLHVTVDAPPTIRVDGALQAALTGAEPWDAPTVAAALASLLTPEQQQKFDEALEFDFAYSLSDDSRFRVNFYQQRGSLGAAFRLIPTEIKPLNELGVPESVSTFAKLPRGLVLVTGPTGSGKSTTLAALIDLVNRTRADHIVTVEDPIEFMHQHKKSLVNQREVGHDTHSFAAALKHVLRQDPDVILIGELRDLETISVALTAAETGHLVFASSARRFCRRRAAAAGSSRRRS